MKPKRADFGKWLSFELRRIKDCEKNVMLTHQEKMSYQGSRITLKKALERWEESV